VVVADWWLRHQRSWEVLDAAVSNSKRKSSMHNIMNCETWRQDAEVHSCHGQNSLDNEKR